MACNAGYLINIVLQIFQNILLKLQEKLKLKKVQQE